MHQTLSLCVYAGLVHSWQRETVTANPWLQNMPITEVVSIILRQLPWMMFSKAILQTGHHLSPLLLAAACCCAMPYLLCLTCNICSHKLSLSDLGLFAPRQAFLVPACAQALPFLLPAVLRIM